MKTKFLRATTDDQLILQGLLYEPEETTNKIVVHVHGMAGNFYENRFLDAMADVFTQGGWAFLTFNNRGHDYIADFPLVGKKEEYKRIGNFKEKFEECILDIKAWIDLIELAGYKNIVLQGHSLGAVKIVYYLAKTQDKRISKLILASPPDMINLFKDDKNYKEMYVLAKKMIKDGKGDELLPKLLWNEYYLSAKTYLDFGTEGNPIAVFSTYSKEKPSLLKDIKVPIFAFYGEKDDGSILPVEESLRIIKTKAINCQRFDVDIINGTSHSYFGHEKEVAKKILNWLRQNYE